MNTVYILLDLFLGTEFTTGNVVGRGDRTQCFNAEEQLLAIRNFYDEKVRQLEEEHRKEIQALENKCSRLLKALEDKNKLLRQAKKDAKLTRSIEVVESREGRNSLGPAELALSPAERGPSLFPCEGPKISTESDFEEWLSAKDVETGHPIVAKEENNIFSIVKKRWGGPDLERNNVPNLEDGKVKANSEGHNTERTEMRKSREREMVDKTLEKDTDKVTGKDMEMKPEEKKKEIFEQRIVEIRKEMIRKEIVEILKRRHAQRKAERRRRLEVLAKEMRDNENKRAEFRRKEEEELLREALSSLVRKEIARRKHRKEMKDKKGQSHSKGELQDSKTKKRTPWFKRRKEEAAARRWRMQRRGKELRNKIKETLKRRYAQWKAERKRRLEDLANNMRGNEHKQAEFRRRVKLEMLREALSAVVRKEIARWKHRQTRQRMTDEKWRKDERHIKDEREVLPIRKGQNQTRREVPGVHSRKRESCGLSDGKKRLLSHCHPQGDGEYHSQK
ncbi:trichohyalin-like [Macrobrachium rosenbergii]|uniref:trichohyalin-like n=1 Tax=Macrobrachium rosenbergii TaxID=79674 RepID=UPI0034D57ADC